MLESGRDAPINAGLAHRKAAKEKRDKTIKAIIPDKDHEYFDSNGGHGLLDLVKAISDMNRSLILTQVGWDLNLSCHHGIPLTPFDIFAHSSLI